MKIGYHANDGQLLLTPFNRFSNGILWLLKTQCMGKGLINDELGNGIALGNVPACQ